MKMKLYLLSAICIIAASILYLYPHPVKDIITYTKLEPRQLKDLEENLHEDGIAAAMHQEFERMKDPATGQVPTERLLVASKSQDQLFATQKQFGINAAVPGISWTERGPNNVGGRTRAVLYDKQDATNKKVWAGGVGGGLWSCGDITAATPVWNKVNDLFDNLAITTLAQSPVSALKMYFGTGEGWFNSDAIRGLGIYETADGGTTWTPIASTANNSTFYYIQKIAVTSTGALLVATRGFGIQRSTDGGATWTQALGNGVGGGNDNNAADIEIAADNKIYVTLGIFSHGGIYRSADDGATFTSIYASSGTEDRIEIAAAPLNAATIYALVQSHTTNGIGKIMKTTNANAVPATNVTWTSVGNPNWCDAGSASTEFTRGQAWYDFIATVDPVDASSNTVYIGGVDLHKTTDGGTTWTQISQWSGGCAGQPVVHADIHSITFKPGSNTEFLVGCDGGIFRTTNSGTAFTNRNTSYNVTQYYACAVHPTSGTNYFLAGAQDNGTQKFSTAGMNTTTTVTGGDGGFCHINQGNPNIQITAFTNNNYSVSTNGGASFTGYGFGGGSFINPTDYDDVNDILYGANAAGQFFRWTNPSTNGPATAISGLGTFTINSVTVSPITLNRVYFGMSDGSVRRVDNANTNSVTVSIIKAAAGGAAVSCVAVDPSNEDHMLVTYSSFGVARIFETTNGTSGSPAWTNVQGTPGSGGLPDMPIRWAMFDPRNSHWAILATELGIWSTDLINGSTTDWQPTNTGFAKVRVDMLQYRSSDRTLIAATHGRGLFSTVIPTVATPGINFETSMAATTEQTVTTTGCRYYRDFTVNMLIDNAPAGDAIATLSVKAGNTATQGLDFDITTNGNFVTPSNTITFLNGSAASQPVTVRVYDDTEIEGDETFTLQYSLAGSTNAVKGTSFQLYSLNIHDNDVGPVLPSAGTASVMTAGTPVANAPFNAQLSGQRTQMLYKASELTAGGVPAGLITSFSINLQKNSTRPYLNFNIKMGTTALNYLVSGGSANVIAVSTVKTLASYSTVNGFNNFVLDVPFNWNGTSNLVVEICYDNGTADGTQLSDVSQGSSDGGTASQGNIFWQDNITCAQSFSTVGFVANGLKPAIKLGFGLAGNPVDSTLATSTSQYFGPNSDIFIYKSSGEVMGHIKNLSSFDYGCTQIIVDRDIPGAAANAVKFWNNTPANYLMSKTFKVIPTNNNPTGSYQITLYYTQNEVNAWQTFTSQSVSNIQMIKVGTQISDVTPANPTGGGTVNTVAATIGSFGSGTILTATFSNGFSGFGAGVAGIALPVYLLDFKGQLKGNSVALDWSTSFELKSRGFDIERSFDGSSFVKVGFVAAAGNSSIKRTYSFADPDIAQELNYYRLKQIDADNKFEYSKVVVVKAAKTFSGSFKVLTNPFTDHLDMQFGHAPSGKVAIRLLDMTGKELYRANSEGIGQARMRINLSARNISAGIYLLEVVVHKERYIERVIKQ